MIVGEYPKIAEEIDTVHLRSFYSRQIFEFLFFQHDSIYWRAVCLSPFGSVRILVCENMVWRAVPRSHSREKRLLAWPCLSVRMYQRSFHWTDFHQIWSRRLF